MALNYGLPGFTKKAKKILGKYLYAFFGQYCEDVVLSSLITKGKLPNDGFYVDLGAFHPLEFSNTAMLNLFGWHGLNVDANPDVIEQFKLYRPKDSNVCVGISNQNETLKYHRFHQNGVNTFCEKHAAKMLSKGAHLEQVIDVECRSVNEILEMYVPDEQHIDVLNIDLEGLDEQIIQAIDWKKYSPTVVLTEAFTEDIDLYICTDTHNYLRQLGYKLISKMGLTAIYIKEAADPASQ